jgi:hypothetical protein
MLAIDIIGKKHGMRKIIQREDGEDFPTMM